MQVPIVLSWFTSPLLCGLATAALFVVLRSAVLRRENSLQLTYVVSHSRRSAQLTVPDSGTGLCWVAGHGVRWLQFPNMRTHDVPPPQ